MSENKDLQAIAEMLNEIKQELKNEIKKEIQASELRTNENIQTAVQASQREIMVFIENVTDRKIQILAEGHGDLLDNQRRLEKGQRDILNQLPNTEKVEDFRQHIAILENVVERHEDEIERLKQA